MSPTHRDEPETTTLAEDDDAEDPRTFVHDSADVVRNGELSAAQLPGGNGNVDPNEPDAQYPPGVVDNRASLPDPAERANFLPEHRRRVEQYRNASANPDYSKNAVE